MVVMERGMGLERTLARLPALFVDDYSDVDERLLRRAYVEALYRAREWDYRRLTHAAASTHPLPTCRA
eukprot:gene7386-22384_t